MFFMISTIIWHHIFRLQRPINDMTGPCNYRKQSSRFRHNIHICPLNLDITLNFASNLPIFSGRKVWTAKNFSKHTPITVNWVSPWQVNILTFHKLGRKMRETHIRIQSVVFKARGILINTLAAMYWYSCRPTKDLRSNRLLELTDIYGGSDNLDVWGTFTTPVPDKSGIVVRLGLASILHHSLLSC